MRRYRRHFLAALALAYALWLAAPVLWEQSQAWLARSRAANDPSLSLAADNSLVYPVQPQQWLQFALPPNTTQLRLLSNAHLSKGLGTPADDKDWAYALRYQFLRPDGSLATQGLYHLRSRLTRYQDAQGGVAYRNYYADPAMTPLDGREVLFDLKTLGDVALLRTSLEATDPAIVAAALRVYMPVKISAPRLATAWLRMGAAQKETLAAGNVYPFWLLSPAEQNNLLAHQWQPIGPSGIAGKDFQIRTLYSLRGLLQQPQGEVLLATGLQADAQHWASMPIPEQGGQLSLDFKALDGSPLSAPLDMDMQWFGRGLEQRWQKRVQWTKDSASKQWPVDGGLLLLKPSAPVLLNAQLATADGAKLDVTPTPLAIKTYVASFGVDFEVLHYRQQPAAMRLDLRQILLPGGSPATEGVEYQWLDKQQRVISRGRLVAPALPSAFDRIAGVTEAKAVGDPMSYFFRLPVEAVRLRVVAQQPTLLVNAYSQPHGLVKTQYVPENAYVGNDLQAAQPSWFPLRAANDGDLNLRQAVQWVSGQYRPPEDDSALLAGQYLWQDYVPEGTAIARLILVAYAGEEPRAEALASVYCPVPSNREQTLVVAGLKGLRSVSPELLFFRPGSAPFNAALSVNGQKSVVMASMGRQGFLPLPELPTGKHRLRLDSDGGGRWLMNYLPHCQGERYLKRRVFALSAKRGLDFVVQHAAQDEVLSARLYSSRDSGERALVKVDILPAAAPQGRPAIATQWTYTQRLYDIRPLPGKPMPVLYSQGQTMHNGERFSIALNGDLPAGSYRVHVELLKGQDAYIALSQTSAGIHEQRRFYRESGIEHD